MRTNHNASGKPSLEGCVGLRYPLRWVLQATYPWVCGILTFMLSLDICTKQTIEKIISFADKTEGLSLKAYALDALNRIDTKTDFEI